MGEGVGVGGGGQIEQVHMHAPVPVSYNTMLDILFRGAVLDHSPWQEIAKNAAAYSARGGKQA